MPSQESHDEPGIVLEPITISALQHYSFCPRQCGLIHLEQCFADNKLTMRGHAVHKRVDQAYGWEEHGLRTEYGLPLCSKKYGLVGKADVVEFLENGTPYPVEFKHGKRAKHIHDEIQLAAQAICLQEMTGLEVNLGAIYHFSSRRRREVKIDAVLIAATVKTIEAVREMINSQILPPPVNDNRCNNCSLFEICQPKIIIDKQRQMKLSAELFS